GFIKYRVGQAMDMFSRTVRPNDPKAVCKITFLTNRLFKTLLQSGPIFRVNDFKKHFIRHLRFLGIQAEDAKLFPGPVDLSSGNIPSPTAGAAQSLPLGEVGLAAP